MRLGFFKFRHKRKKQKEEEKPTNTNNSPLEQLDEINKTEAKDDIAAVGKAEYLITLKEEIGDTLREVTHFTASRWVDKEEYLVYLYNPKLNFMELFPQRDKDLIKLNKKEIREKLKNKRAELKKLEETTDPVKVNKKNVELEVMKLEAKLKASDWEKTAFLEFGSKGEKKITFMREGTNMFPIAYDSKRNIYGIPSDIRKKSAAILMRNKENKYNRHKAILEGGVFGALVLSIIFMLLSGYTLFKAYNLYEENPINQAKIDTLDVANECSNIALNNAKQVNEIFKTIKGDLNKPQTVIEGVQPKTIGG